MMNKQTYLKKYGPWALVTGASDGIGNELAKELAAIGFNLVIVARRESLLQEQAEKLIKKYGVDVIPFSADLSKSDDIELINRKTEKIDIGLFIASAGFGTSGNFINSSINNELNMIDVNCRALAQQSHEFARRFVKRGRGGIILLSSILAFQGVPRSANYSATKAYVQTLVEGLYSELKPLKVDVLAAAPGPVKTGFANRSDMNTSMAQNPQTVARATLKALGMKRTVIPGWLSKLLGYSLATSPRWGRIKILTQVMKDMTKHQAIRNET